MARIHAILFVQAHETMMPAASSFQFSWPRSASWAWVVTVAAVLTPTFVLLWFILDNLVFVAAPEPTLLFPYSLARVPSSAVHPNLRPHPLFRAYAKSGGGRSGLVNAGDNLYSAHPSTSRTLAILPMMSGSPPVLINSKWVYCSGGREG